ncbi:MAG: GNAT family N-acetyltransferase [Eubacteriales bacterium]|nr:GNAT family N-acetyltransferase [Eubacteriales bacterium]
MGLLFFDTGDLSDGEICLRLERTVEAQPEKGYVPAYFFQIVRLSDQAEVGWCDLRVGHNQNTFYGGNIGYGIREAYRGNHYAGKACRLLLALARKHDMGFVLITCAPENLASQKTCLYCGAHLKQIVTLPAWHALYKEGRRTSCQYEVTV